VGERVINILPDNVNQFAANLGNYKRESNAKWHLWSWSRA